MNSTYTIRKTVQKINASKRKENRMPKLHHSLTEKRILDAVEQDENIGFCLDCGEEHSNIEPDAESYVCQCCGENSVSGAEQILLLMVE